MPAAQARSRLRCESRRPITEHLLQHDSPNANRSGEGSARLTRVSPLLQGDAGVSQQVLYEPAFGRENVRHQPRDAGW